MCGLTSVPHIMSLAKCMCSGWLISHVMWILQWSQLNLSNPDWMGSWWASWLGTIVNSLWIYKVPAKAFISIYLDYLLPDWSHVTKSAINPFTKIPGSDYQTFVFVSKSQFPRNRGWKAARLRGPPRRAGCSSCLWEAGCPGQTVGGGDEGILPQTIGWFCYLYLS